MWHPVPEGAGYKTHLKSWVLGTMLKQGRGAIMCDVRYCVKPGGGGSFVEHGLWTHER